MAIRPLFPDRIGVWKVLIFCGGKKTGEFGENPRSKEQNQQQTRPTRTPGWDSKLGHIDDRQALSPLRHSCCGRFHLACRIRLAHGPLRQAFGRKFEGSNSDEQYIYFTYRYCSVCKPFPSP